MPKLDGRELGSWGLGGLVVALVLGSAGRAAAEERVTIVCAPTCVADADPRAGTAVQLVIAAGGAPRSVSVAAPELAAPIGCDGGCALAWPGAAKLRVVIDGDEQPVEVEPAELEIARRGFAVPTLTRGAPGRTKVFGRASFDVPGRARVFGRDAFDLPAPGAAGPFVQETPALAPVTAKVIGREVPAPRTSQEIEEALDTYLEDVVIVGAGCSGVAVAPRAILTARHCAAARWIGVERAARRIEELRVVASDVPDDPADDVALLWTERELRVSVRERAAGNDAVETGLVRLAGYGANERGGRRGFGRKRQALVPISNWRCTQGVAARTGCRLGREVVVVAAGADTCNGDSGGPLLARRGGRWKLVAITSRAVPGRGAPCGRGGIYTPLDRVDPWLSRTLQRGAR